MRYHNITTDDMRNGDGLRVVLWLSGCDHQCKGCQNPITWDANDGEIFDYSTEAEIIEKLKPDYITGLTLSGGDPLFTHNRYEIRYLLERLEAFGAINNKTVWLYTGYTWEELLKIQFDDPDVMVILQYVDVLVDGRFVEELKDENYPWAGSTNQRIIDVQKSLMKGDIVYHVDYKERQHIRGFQQTKNCKCCE